MSTTEALAAIRGFWLSEGSLPIEQDSHASCAWRKLMVESARFQRAHPQTHKQFEKLRRFYQKATFGPALGISQKRFRVAIFLNGWHYFCRDDESKNTLGQLLTTDMMGEPGIALQRYLAVLKPILEALQNEDEEFFSDLAIAIRLKKHQSLVDAFLAEYSLLMLGKPPALTFSELCKIVDWQAADLRKKIRKLRGTYGERAVPLKRGKSGNPGGSAH